MLRRRNAVIIALLLASIGILYVTFIQENFLKDVYPDIITAVPNSYFITSPSSIEPSSGKISESNCSSGILMYENYCIISPYENELKNTTNVGLVTLCTQGTIEFLQHVVVLCYRWSGPISVAVYSPKEDYVEAHHTVHLLRQCNLCVRYWVRWHFFFLKQSMPQIKDFQQLKDCSSITKKKPKKRRSQGVYPINVGRNIARRLARTPYVFSSDIELYPSLNIPIKFEQMLRSQNSSMANEVWVLPVFEVYWKFRAPLIKSELRAMFHKKQAISFHQYRCAVCHKIPNLTLWIGKEVESKTEVEDSLEPLKVWATVKRNRYFKLQAWEPFFIGTTNDPEFDIRLSWEGKQNKMQMAYEMCMRNYTFHIIENAFLVHKPGINVYNASKERPRQKYLASNNQVMFTIKKDLVKKYGLKNNC